MIPVISMILFSGFNVHINVHNGTTYIVLDDGWIVFKVEEHKIAEMMKMLRLELVTLLEEKIGDPLLNLMHSSKEEHFNSVQEKIRLDGFLQTSSSPFCNAKFFIFVLSIGATSSFWAQSFYMTLAKHKETSLTKGIVGSAGPRQARCMTSHRQPVTCYRKTKFSSNRHRKLQPFFRET
ncbi:hypothetical protein QE152_g6341 [Popillia japonica]|uniref:RNA helicase C-terminal domain-containing protein n=1 Tax=Popillia japonica TaxID=7064 RepID=A0AAW1MFQ9_POPJA